jgi:hypothetical protein
MDQFFPFVLKLFRFFFKKSTDSLKLIYKMKKRKKKIFDVKARTTVPLCGHCAGKSTVLLSYRNILIQGPYLPADVTKAVSNIFNSCPFELNNAETMFIFSVLNQPSKIYTWSTNTWRDATPMNTFDASKYIFNKCAHLIADLGRSF